MTKHFTRFQQLFFSFFLIFSLVLASVAEARPGGGRSMGFRGSRGFGTRSAPSSPYRYNPGGQPQNPNPSQPQQAPYRSQGPFGYQSNPTSNSGGFMRGLLGGLAGGMIGSMLFGGLSRAAGHGFGGGGIGLLDILLLAGLGFLIFRLIAGRRFAAAGTGAYREMSHYEKLRSVEPGPYAAAPQPQEYGSEEVRAQTLARYDAAFDLSSFKEGRMDDFMRLQSAWNQRDLSPVATLIAPELRDHLDKDIGQLKAEGRINRIENIAVRGSELIEAWQERGQEYATVRFRANLLDYTIDEKSGAVVAGDRSQPVKFEEDWTFVRPIDRAPTADSWRITSIEA